MKRISGFYNKRNFTKKEKRELQMYVPLFKLVYHYGVSRQVIAEALGLYPDQITPRMEGRYPISDIEKLKIDELVMDAANGLLKRRNGFNVSARKRTRPTKDFWEKDRAKRKDLDYKVASEMGYLLHHESLVILEGHISAVEDQWWMQTLSGAWIRLEFLNGCSKRVSSKKVVVAGNLGSCGAGAITQINDAVIINAQAADMMLIRVFISRIMKPLVQFPRSHQHACQSLSVSQLRHRRSHLYRLSRLWLTRLGASIFSTSWLHFAGDQERRINGKRIPLTAGAFRYSGFIAPAEPLRPTVQPPDDPEPIYRERDIREIADRKQYIRPPEIVAKIIDRNQAYQPQRRGKINENS